jgi:hypothetical protein
MLAPAMRTRLTALLVLVLAALALAAAGCGEEEGEGEAIEGEPVDVGELAYNVQITRFLNPADNEDSEYLVGQPEAPPGKLYLGVFLVIENPSEEAQLSASQYTVHDTLENEYEPLESESPYALDIGAEVPADEQLPLPDTTPYAGFNKGTLLIFEVDESVSENRPLRLAIEDGGESHEVTLDI